MEFGIVLQNCRTGKELYFSGASQINTPSFKRAFGVEDLEDLELVDIQASSAFNQLSGRSLSELEDIASALEDVADWQELYNLLNDTSDLDVSGWYEFNEENFRALFSNPYEAARAVYFGKVKSWSDGYFRLNGYENVETTDELDYDSESTQILKRWLDENY